MSHIARPVLAGLLAVALVAAVVSAGCGVTASPSPVPTAGPTSAPTGAPTVEPTAGPTGQPTEVPVETPALPDWTCDGTTIHLAGTAVRAQQNDMTVVTTAGVGQVVFGFEPIGGALTVPEVEIRPAVPLFTMDPSGLPVVVDGLAWATIVLRGGTGLDEDYEPTYTGPDRWSALEAPLVEVVRTGDFEAVSTWVVGLAGPYCVRAHAQAAGASAASSLVVEFRAQ